MMFKICSSNTDRGCRQLWEHTIGYMDGHYTLKRKLVCAKCFQCSETGFTEKRIKVNAQCSESQVSLLGREE